MQTAPIAVASAATSGPVGEDATAEDRKSFADCLKETHDDSDKDHQTAATPRSQASPNAAAGSTKEPHRKTADAASPIAVAVPVMHPQVLDTRGLALSLHKTSAAQSRPVASASEPSAAAAPVSAASTPASSATSKAPLAFSVSIRKNGLEKGVAPQHEAGESAAVPSSTVGNTGSAGRGHAGSKDSGASSQNGQSDTPANSDSKVTAQTASSGTPVAPVAPTIAAPAVVAAAMPHAAVAAYTAASPAASTAATTSAASVAAVAEPVTPPTVRPQSIDIQIPGAGGEGVDVRVSQRAGDMQVTVRTPDSDLAQSLRQHLPELSDRLSQSGVAGDIWQPAAMSAGESSLNNGSGYDEPGGNWQGQQDSSQQQSQTDADPDQNGGGWANDSRNAEQEAQ